MVQVNENFFKLQAGYLFPEIGRRVKAFSEANPNANIIRLGIGDVTEPLPMACVAAMHAAIDELAQRSTFRGYGPEQGYDFLREAIAKNDYQDRGINIAADEIFVSDGSKCDCGNILDILGSGNRIAVCDPVYPVYVDTNVMAGNTGSYNDVNRFDGLVYLEMNAENGFEPEIPDFPVDVVYLCFPNNPTGAVASHETLTRWVEYATKHKSLILYDAAYEAFISDDSIPRSIFEIEGARKVAIEMRSFSKTAGFTGVRCAFTVIPKDLVVTISTGEERSLHAMWYRRHTTKFNGVSYPVQRGAAAIYTPEGKQQVRHLISHYMNNASLLLAGIESVGWQCFGGEHAPYVWLKTPDQMGSWQFFDALLEKCNIVGTPGAGFGSAGEGYFRLSAFNSTEKTVEAVQRIQDCFAASVVSESERK